MNQLTQGGLSTILQLSVGANLGFTTVLSLFDNPLSRERKAAESLELTVKAFDTAVVESSETVTVRDAVVKVEHLNTELEKFSAHLEVWTYRRFRPASAFSACLASFLLVVATYHGGDPAGWLFQTLSFGSLFSIFAFSFYALVSTFLKLKAFGRIRDGINHQLLPLAVKYGVKLKK